MSGGHAQTEGRMLRHPSLGRQLDSGDRDEVDHEDEGLAAEEVAAGGAVGEVRRDDEFAAAADLHARDAVLPALDEAAQRELDALAAVPRGVELLAGLVLDARVVDGDGVAGLGLGAVTRR